MFSFVDRSFFRKLVSLAVPVTLQSLLYSSRGFVDMMMLGQLGEAPLAAVGLVTSVMFVALHVVTGLSSGVGILGAQYFGADNPRGVQRSVALGIVTALSVGVPLCLLMLALPEAFVRIVTDRSELFPLGVDYLRWVAFQLVAASIAIPFEAGLASIGRPGMNLVFNALGVAVNLGLNWVLIFGNLGAPALGLTGAGIATFVSVTVETAAIAAFLYGTRHSVAVRGEVLREALVPTEIRRFLALSVPLAIGGVLWSIGMLLYNVAYGHMGTVELAVMSIIAPITSLCFAAYWGVSSAAGIMIGHHLGAGQRREARVRSWVLTALGTVTAVLVAAAIWWSRASIFALYDGLAASTLALAEGVLAVALATIWVRAINVVVIVGVLQSGGDNRFVLRMDMFCQWCVGIPLTYLTAFYWHLSLPWVFAAATGEEMIKLFICVPRLHGGKWMRNLVSSEAGEGVVRRR